MDLNQINGRLMAVEALVTEMMAKLPPETAAEIIKLAMPRLQRVDTKTAAGTTTLVRSISQRIGR